MDFVLNDVVDLVQSCSLVDVHAVSCRHHRVVVTGIRLFQVALIRLKDTCIVNACKTCRLDAASRSKKNLCGQQETKHVYRSLRENNLQPTFLISFSH